MISTFRKARQILTPAQRRSAVVLTCLMVVGMLLETLGIGLVIPAIALMTRSDAVAHIAWLQPILKSMGASTQADLISIFIVGLVLIYLVKNLFLAVLVWRQTRFAYGMQTELSERLYSIYLHQSYSFHLQRNSAQLIRNAIGEVTLFADAIMSSLIILTEVLVLIGIGTLLLFVEPLGAIVVALVLGFAGWVFYHTTRNRVLRWGADRQHHEGQRVQQLQQGLGGVKDVKLLGREANFLAQYRVHNAKSVRAGRLQVTVQLLPRLWLELLAVFGLAALVLTMLASGRDASTLLPTLGLFAAAAFRLMPSMNRVLAATHIFRYNLPVINTLHAEIELDSSDGAAARNKGDGRSPMAFETDIRLVDIAYTYANAKDAALERLTLQIGKGECVGFVGASGAGKSTIVDVILGLLKPSLGQVLVDGKDIQADLRAWQNRIGYVPQAIFLIDDTLRRNVAFGLSGDEIDEGAIRRAIRAAQLEEFVEQLPLGLDTVVGERGVRLSGGQRQRIGIARALYHNPDVLVLDEATSALDGATESDVMQAVLALRGSKTVLIVAHRLSTVEHCDRLYRLEGGHIVAGGCPEQMLKVPATG